ncbi:hypothetical protein Rhe02_35480 [Rhizocola hellebori]|uniref:Uncharacterized protein n=1 Tax=Rhizocola hellebori TaxID=1392758 RepID=A0A8J3Q969_9ACTN|nr:hypothetical protein [Rhizocola hellebori]GIH05481.1 hypothetical protein Rhe02_35480 [Rhizocola hellebori]
MRALALYLRSRAVPATVAVVLGCAVALWALGRTVDHPLARALAAILITLAATTAISHGLAGPDHDLDTTAAIAWPPRRAAHIIVAGAAVLGLLAAAALAGEPMTSIGQLLRNVAGLTGLVAFGAVVLGAARAPLIPVLWTLLVLGSVPEPPARPTYKVIFTWMVQPTDNRTAMLAATAIAVSGILGYAMLGSRR